MNPTRQPTLAEEQARIDAARDYYLAHGGSIEVLPSFQYVPKPTKLDAGKEPPAPQPKTPRIKTEAELRAIRDRQVIEARARQVERVREAAKTMNQSQAAEALQLSRRTLAGIARAHGFEFAPQVRTAPKNRPDVAGDSAMAERVIALRDVGLSRRQVRSHLGLAHVQLNRILEAHGIDFPLTTKGRPCGDFRRK